MYKIPLKLINTGNPSDINVDTITQKNSRQKVDSQKKAKFLLEQNQHSKVNKAKRHI